MNTETNLIKKYLDKGVLYGNELIIRKVFCDEFISSSKSLGLAVVGIEGFNQLKDGNMQPNMDEIADFSEIEANDWDEYLSFCTSAARNFIKHMLSKGESYGYCFTLVNHYEKNCT